MQSSPEKENPDSVAAEIGVQDGIEALPKRVERYEKAKNSALDIAEYMGTLPKHQAVAHRVKGCGRSFRLLRLAGNKSSISDRSGGRP